MGYLLDTIQLPQGIKRLSRTELDALVKEIRAFLIDSISRTGGHIGANLGVVELTVALHRYFSSPATPFFFDTGHQGYTHKLLTGRKALFATLNQYGGMNRFLSPKESAYDPFEVSHAGTAISVGLGSAIAKAHRGDSAPVVCVVGDSALAEGVAFEGLNHAAVEAVRMIVVINDNGYAISPGFGALHNALQSAKGKKAREFFEALGASYHGPIDGHSLDRLSECFEGLPITPGLQIVHVKTVKGYGWPPSDQHPYRMHFSFPFDPETGSPRLTPAPKTGFPELVAEVVDKHMETHPNSVCVTPSTLYATGLSPIFEKYPERCFDPGMEEQHALSMAVGFALQDLLPIIAFQSTFLQRAFDQLIHDVAFTNKPCLILSYRCGFSGYDNPTHHGIYDIAYLSPIPNLDIYYPKDGPEAQRMVATLLENVDKPTMVMMPYGPAQDLGIDPNERESVLSPETLKQGEDLLMIAVGNKVAACLNAAERLEARGIKSSVVNIRQLKPLPEKAIKELLASHDKVVTVEEAILSGGFGHGINSIAVCLPDPRPRLLNLGLPTIFVEAGSNQELEEAYGLNGEGICRNIQQEWFQGGETQEHGRV